MTGSLLDVCLALLLVSGAAVTLVDANSMAVDADADADVDRAGGTAAILATTTEAIEYSLGSDRSGASLEAERVAHGTLAAHLARAALRGATVDGTTLSPAVAGYRRAVRAVVAATIGSRTSVHAAWRPLPGSGLAGDIRVGSQPPSTATVHAARFTVPVGGASTDERDGDSTGAAGTAISVLFPPARIAAAARDDSPGSDALADRIDEDGSPTRTDPAAIDRPDRPVRVVIVVRTWSM